MSGKRLDGKAGIVVGAGQTPGETVGNGRAASILFAREGAHLILVDRDLKSAEETAESIRHEGGTAECVEGDWTKAADCEAYARACVDAYGRIDFLHNNVGIGMGDASLLKLEEDVYDRIMQVNLKGCLLSCKAVLPQMRTQESGSIVNISSLAAVASTNLTAYKLSKMAMNALGQNLANSNARFGIRVNTIMPGLIDTPICVDDAARAMGISRDDYAKGRDAMVPLRGKQGTAWDVAHAALFLASDASSWMTGVTLDVAGGEVMI